MNAVKIQARSIGTRAPIMYMCRFRNTYGLVSEIEIKEGDVLARHLDATGWNVIIVKKILSTEEVTGRYEKQTVVIKGKRRSTINFAGAAHYYLLDVEYRMIPNMEIEFLDQEKEEAEEEESVTI